MQADMPLELGASVGQQIAHQAESELQVPNLKRKSTEDVDQDAAAEESAFLNNRALEIRRHESFVEHEKDFAKIQKKVSEYNEKITAERNRADQIFRDIDSLTQSLDQEPILGVPTPKSVIFVLPSLRACSERLLSEIAYSSLTNHEKLTAIDQVKEESDKTAIQLDRLICAQDQLIKRLEKSKRDILAYTVSHVVRLNNFHIALKKSLRSDASDSVSDDPNDSD
jgi:chromosome segregation ATPase